MGCSSIAAGIWNQDPMAEKAKLVDCSGLDNTIHSSTQEGFKLLLMHLLP